MQRSLRGVDRTWGGLTARYLALGLGLALALAGTGCADVEELNLLDEPGEEIDHEFFDNELAFKNNGSLRTINDLVRSGGCSTEPANRLSMQLAQEMACMAPDQWARIDGLPNVRFGPAGYPFLSKQAAAAFERAAASGASISVNSTWRSVAQQFILKQKEGTCGIRVAASPGRSMHESGLAIDINESANASVRQALRNAGFTWYCDTTNGGRLSGCRDPVHFTFARGTDLRDLSIKAFQALHNRNKPASEHLTVDGDLGARTRTALLAAPLAGFPVAANCGLDFGAGGTNSGVGVGTGGNEGGADPAAPAPLPAPYQRAFIGTECTDDAVCDFDHSGRAAICLAPEGSRAGGRCSVACEGFCPDRAGYDVTFCVDASAMGYNGGGGLCTVKASSRNRNCDGLTGMVLMEMERHVGRSGAQRVVERVCIPDVVNFTPGPDPGVEPDPTPDPIDDPPVDPGPDEDPRPAEPAPTTGTAATQACERLVDALVNRVAVVCGNDPVAYRADLLNAAVGGSCNNVVGIRDLVSLNNQCIPWVADASCTALSTSIPASCREQLIVGGGAPAGGESPPGG